MNIIEQLRTEKKWKRTRLAKESGVSSVTLWKLERRDYKAKSFKIEAIANALDVPYQILRNFIK
jgi:transcriptional regulator with XRE-family HTH domain